MPKTPSQLDHGDQHDDVCRSCGLDPRNNSIHCIRTSSPAPPPSYRSIALPSATSRTPAGPPRRWPQLQPLLPVLRFDVSNAERRPRMRIRRSEFSPLSPRGRANAAVDFGRTTYTSETSLPNTPIDDRQSSGRRIFGLRVPKTQAHRTLSPTRSPGGEKLARAEKGEHPKRDFLFDKANRIKLQGWKSGTIKP